MASALRDSQSDLLVAARIDAFLGPPSVLDLRLHLVSP